MEKKKYQIKIQHPLSGVSWISNIIELSEKQYKNIESLFENDDSHFNLKEGKVERTIFSPNLLRQCVKTIIEVTDD